MIRLGIIVGSTRVHRLGRSVADWTLEATRRLAAQDVEIELVDLADFALPVLDEPAPAMTGAVAHAHTKRWGAAIAAFDGFIVVTPEYNHGVPGSLKNAIDYLFHEWNDKAVGFVSYGAHGGVRAVEQLRQTAAEIKLADVRAQVVLSIYTDVDYTGFDVSDPTTIGSFAPAERHLDDLAELLGEVTDWSRALKDLRDRRNGGDDG